MTDDDTASDGAFDAATKIAKELSSTKHMLCVFHAVAMRYQDVVYGFLPKTRGGKILTAKGAICGDMTPFTLYLCKAITLTNLSHDLIGDLVLQFFMKISKSCRNKTKYDRYHVELTFFVNLSTARSILSCDCINEIKGMKRDIRAREHKVASYARRGLKSHMLAMTTSPVEGQNKHICHGKYRVGVKYQTDDVLVRIVTRIQRNYRKRKARAHDELSANCLFLNTWSRTYIICKGQGLVDRFHQQHLYLKSAHLSKNVYITWNFDLEDVIEHPDLLYVHLPIMLRVEELNLDTAGKFVKCTCGGREGVGVPL